MKDIRNCLISKFKVGDELVADDVGYWGTKYDHSTVKVSQCQHPLYTVEAFDGKIFNAHYSMMLCPEDFYGRASGRTGFEDGFSLPDVPKCNCDILALMRVGCRCGGV